MSVQDDEVEERNGELKTGPRGERIPADPDKELEMKKAWETHSEKKDEKTTATTPKNRTLRTDWEKAILTEIQKNPNVEREQLGKLLYGEWDEKIAHGISDRLYQLKKGKLITKTKVAEGGEYKLTVKGEKYLLEEEQPKEEESPPEAPDPLDEKIIELINKNPKLLKKDIAKKLKVSGATITTHTQKLKKMGLLPEKEVVARSEGYAKALDDVSKAPEAIKKMQEERQKTNEMLYEKKPMDKLAESVLTVPPEEQKTNKYGKEALQERALEDTYNEIPKLKNELEFYADRCEKAEKRNEALRCLVTAIIKVVALELEDED